MSRADELRAELDVMDLEQRLVDAKAAGTLTDELKHELRAARQAFRLARAGEPPGEGVARPATIEVVGSVE